MEQTEKCQSCGMTMTSVVFGTNADGGTNPDYCRFCYVDGKFREPNLTKDDVIDKIAGALMKSSQLSKTQAVNMAKTAVSKLKRWNESNFPELKNF